MVVVVVCCVVVVVCCWFVGFVALLFPRWTPVELLVFLRCERVEWSAEFGKTVETCTGHLVKTHLVPRAPVGVGFVGFVACCLLQ